MPEVTGYVRTTLDTEETPRYVVGFVDESGEQVGASDARFVMACWIQPDGLDGDMANSYFRGVATGEEISSMIKDLIEVVRRFHPEAWAELADWVGLVRVPELLEKMDDV